MPSLYPALGSVLATLRVGQGWSRDDLAGHLGMDSSYLARVERGERRPSSKALDRWLAVCPVPVYPATALGLDLSPWLTISPERQETPTPADRDWVLTQLLVVADPVPTDWLIPAVTALHWVPSVVTPPLADLLWLNVRAGRHQRLPLAEAIDLKALQDHDLEEMPGWAYREWLEPLWAELAALPVESAARPADVLWDQLEGLWPRLPEVARRGLVAAAESWAKA